MPKVTVKPKLSVIVPVYNCKKYIGSTIESLVRLSKKIDMEIIFQNANSTDGTSEIIDNYCSKYPNFIHYREKDLGQSDAINKGVNKATGNWVTWLCADDLLLDDFEKMFIDKNMPGETDVIYGDCVLLLEDGNLDAAIGTENYTPGKLAKKRMFIQQPGTCILKEKWEVISGLKIALNWTMDYDLFLRLEAAGSRFRRYDLFVSVARIHGDAKTSSGSFKRLIEYYKMFFSSQLHNLNNFSLKPYAIYLIEYFIKKLESKQNRIPGLSHLHRIFWKIAKPQEKDDILGRFWSQKSILSRNIKQLESSR